MENCSHSTVYYGVVNIFLRTAQDPFGAVDVWICTKCRDLFCEDKRWGLTELSSVVGFPKRDEGSKWAILICMIGAEVKWELLEAKPGKQFDHSCVDGKTCPLTVNDNYSVSAAEAQSPSKHSLYLVDGRINRSIIVK
ncbi:MAG: hypothetical protein HYU39_09000 [Thaumarchaeota archaeon]|nr:hypothetical protein [Nitrososphaerota archaeon]